MSYLSVVFAILGMFCMQIVLATANNEIEFNRSEDIQKSNNSCNSLSARDSYSVIHNCAIETEGYKSITILADTSGGQYENKNGNWYINRWTSDMDSSEAIEAYVYAENEIEDWLQKSHRPKLIIRCLENKTDVIVRTDVSVNPELGLYHEYTMRIRLDSGKPIKQRWGESTNNVALFAPQPIKLARQIHKSEKMLFEFIPFQMSPQVIEFNVKGLEPYLKEIAETCNWKL